MNYKLVCVYDKNGRDLKFTSSKCPCFCLFVFSDSQMMLIIFLFALFACFVSWLFVIFQCCLFVFVFVFLKGEECCSLFCCFYTLYDIFKLN